jgi:hypothetical protein
MTVSNNSKCPNCGGDLKHYDKVRRIVRTKGGVKSWHFVERLRCVVCRRLHRLLPEFIFPYKHYDAEIIQGVIDGLITPDTIGYEDFPCEMTMLRWTRE